MVKQSEEDTEIFEATPIYRKHGGKHHTGAIILVFLGLIFLLNNLGFLSANIWNELWKFWPVIFIIVGLQIFLGRSNLARVVTMVITLIILALIVLYVLYLNGYYIPGPFFKQVYRP